MRIIRHPQALPPDQLHDRPQEQPGNQGGAVVAIGNFDGVHLGHQAVIGVAREIARAGGGETAVLTFEPHPRSFFTPAAAPFRLTPFRTKAQLLRRLGVDLMVDLRFDAARAAQSAEDFVRSVLVAGLGIRHAVVGYDFVFGNRRQGTAQTLTEMGRSLGFGVTTVDPVQAGDAVYSSTRIRHLLEAAKPREAASLLGRPWEIDGRVERGDQRGRTIGFPTANLFLADYLRPAAGVYAVRAAIARAPDDSAPDNENGDNENGDDESGDDTAVWHDAVANFGRRPTFGGTDLRLEVHLFDFAGDLYGKHLRVQLIDYIRPEQKFAGLDALKAQIAADAAAARRILAAVPA